MATTETSVGGSERRRAPRVPLHGFAVLHGERVAARGSIENLSLGGALLRLREPTPIDRQQGMAIDLRLSSATRITVAAETVRIERRDDGARVAVRFRRLTADHEDAIEDAIANAIAAARARPVLVVDGIEDRRLDLADALRDLRMTPLAPRTPLEVIDLLSTPERNVRIAAVGARFGDVHGREIAEVIAESFPWVRIMYIGNDARAMATDIEHAWADSFE
jgi:hypothetical protein